MLSVNELLDTIVAEYKEILKDNLVGIYLHGSLVMGCFNPANSDIDFLVVVKENISVSNLRGLIDVLLNYASMGPQKGFEMSVILRDDAKNFVYPTPFILHFSDFHKERYVQDSAYICGGFTDPDLAAHIMIIRERGICLFGEPIDTLFMPVPKKDYIKSIMYDIVESKAEIIGNPTYYILNLCRVLYYVKEEIVSSKKEGGEWGYNHLPEEYREIIELALCDYEGKGKCINWEDSTLTKYAEYMLVQINESIQSFGG